MARRDRYKDLVWLKGLITDTPGGQPLVAGHTPTELQTYIGLLTGGYGLWIEIEKSGDTYSLRCYPKRPPGGTKRPVICASYEGPNLGRVLLVAAEDYREYLNDPRSATFTRYETCRRVA